MKKVGTKKILKPAGTQKDMSVSELSKVMLNGFQKIDKKFEDADMKHDELAGMVARGFTELRKDMDEGFERVDGRFVVLEHKVDRIQDSVNEISYDSRKKTTRIENLELKVFGSIQEA